MFRSQKTVTEKKRIQDIKKNYGATNEYIQSCHDRHTKMNNSTNQLIDFVLNEYVKYMDYHHNTTRDFSEAWETMMERDITIISS